MSQIAVDTKLGSLLTYVFPAGYDSAKLGLGPLMVQNNGSGNEGKWVGPLPIGVARPVETAAAIPGVFPWAMQWSSTIDWVFLADNAAAAVSRRVQLYEYNRVTSAFTWKGFITMSYPFAGTQGTSTIRAFRMSYETYTTGTVGVSGTAVTGSATTWQTNRLTVGNRIGFGSTDPTQISTWYLISAIASDTSITLSTDAGSIASSTAYVIEDLRCVTAVTNATTLSNGGLFLAKGLSYNDFFSGGTAIAAASATDNVKANYWLGDAPTSLNTASFGMGIQTRTDWNTQFVWVGDTLANPLLYKYNIRRNLTLATGKDTTAFTFRTGAGGAVTGTTSQVNNGRLVTAAHGPGSGLSCFYFTTTTRIYRSIDVSSITASSTTWLSSGDVMTEIPPGSVNTFAATAGLSAIEFSSSLDNFIISTSGAGGFRSYVTRYFNDGSQIDRIFLLESRQIDQVSADPGTTPFATTNSVSQTSWTEGGVLYMAGVGTAATTNILRAIPIGADWEYATSTSCRVVTPSIATPNCSNFTRLYLNTIQVLGGDTGHNLGQAPEGIRAYYRTTGISDNSGPWTLLDDSGDLSGVDSSPAIQFMFEYKVINLTCIPSRLLSYAVLYEDLSTDSHYQPSVAHSDTVNKRFAWRFSTAFGGTVPTLSIQLFDAVSGGTLVTNDTVAHAGSWQKSTDDGATWGSYNTTDKASDITYIRYTPASLGDNIKVRALLTQL